ncbi:hypothetical protein [Piscibacillus salipiscarius]|uniref:LIM zinc-binding domain-containing protein n=1 Tax=Piscibacillus salipiscarius TaxID=299480 RepID=A0ABW5Q8S4_9BACI
MNCSRCDKDLVNKVYKIKFRDEVLCWPCYKSIPQQERLQAIQERHKG